MNPRNRIAAWVILAAGIACARTEGPEVFTLVEAGEAVAAFHVPLEQARRFEDCPVASTMIADFNADLWECAGCALPVTETDDGQTPVIRFAVESREAADEDRFAIDFPDARTLRITGSTVSLRWALNHILETHAGVRYLFPSANGTHYPTITDLRLPRRPLHRSPSFNLSRRITHAPDWDRRLGNWLPVTKRLPRGHNLHRHAFPVERYIREERFPEYIFPVLDGQRYLPHQDPARQKAWSEFTGRWSDYAVGWQPCLTDERVEGEAVRNLIDFFDRHPGVRGISMTQNDHGVFCRCETCDARQGGRRNDLGFLDYSPLYYAWLNRIVAQVVERHPDTYYGIVTYRETAEPPGFPLHERIVPFLLFDTQQALDPEVHARRRVFFERWAGTATGLGARSYTWGWTYDLPRVYFGLQREMLKAAHTLGARSLYATGAVGIEEGPKLYLYHKLAWDVDLDLEATLLDWYEACVGVSAAPALAAYFARWEIIWREQAVHTSWFQNGKDKTYLSFDSDKSYLFAVGPDDLPALRALMETVGARAGRDGDARQQIRAGWLMRGFEYAEACAYAMGGPFVPPSGVIETAEQALAYLDFLPRAVEYDQRRVARFAERAADPDIGFIYGQGREPHPSYVPSALARAAAQAADARVRAGLQREAGNEILPTDVRGLLRVLLRIESGEPVENRLRDGVFETGNQDWQQGRVSGERAYRGAQSLRLNLGPPHRTILSAHGRDFPREPAAPGPYFIRFRVFVEAEHPDAESHVQFRVTAYRDGRGVAHWDSARVHVPPGDWVQLSLVADTSLRGGDTLQLDRIHFRNYNPGDVAYIDDVWVVPLLDPES